MAGLKPLIVCFGFILTWVSPVLGYVDPTLAPPVVRDQLGNVADENDVITWSSSYPKGKSYLSADEVNRDDINSKYYAIVDSFTNVVQPQDPPYDLMSELMKSRLDISGEIMTLVKFGAGIATCFALGILFIVLMPVVGFCFCCCRTCGKCGGKLTSRPSDENSSCWCRLHAMMLLVVSLVMMIGCVLFFRSAGEMRKGAEAAIEASKYNIRDITTFVNNMAQEIDFLVLGGYKFSAEVLKRDLDNIDYLVGLKLRTEIDQETNIEHHFRSIVELGQDVPSILEREKVINDSTVELQEMGNDLQTNLDVIRQQFEDVYNSSGCGLKCQQLINATSANISMEVDFSQIPDLTKVMELLKTVEKANLSYLVVKDKKDFMEIPERIKNQTKDQINDIKKSLDGFSNDVRESVLSVNTIADSMTPYLNDYTKYIDQAGVNFDQYKQYITYTGYGIVTVASVIIALQVLGAFGALYYYDNSVAPEKRSSSSHRMSNLLLAAAGLSFIISWILMILVSLPFLIGIILDRDVCDQITSPDYPLLKKMIDIPDGPLGGGYILSKVILQDPNIPLTVSDMLTACSDNEAAFKALRLEHLIDLNETTNYKSLDIDANFNDMSVDFSDIGLISSTTSHILDVYTQAINIDYASFISVLTTDVTKGNLTKLAEDIRIVANDQNTTDPAKAELELIANYLEKNQSEKVTPIESNQTRLLEEVLTLKNKTDANRKTINETKEGLNTSKQYLYEKTGPMFIKTLKDFQNRVYLVLDSFVNRTVNGVQKEVGGCRPLYNIWSSILEGAICVHFILPYNGFWFSLGWLVFFLIPSIIYNVKLAKYIRKMEYKRNSVLPEERKAI